MLLGPGRANGRGVPLRGILDRQFGLFGSRFMNRPGFAGGRLVWVTPPWLVVPVWRSSVLGFGRWHVADGLQEPPGIEPIDPLEGRELDRFERAPRSTPMDHFGFVQAVEERPWPKLLGGQGLLAGWVRGWGLRGTPSGTSPLNALAFARLIRANLMHRRSIVDLLPTPSPPKRQP
jgi:hypothetical protein